MRLHAPLPRTRTDNTIALINVVFLMLIFFLFAGSVEPNDARKITPPEVTVEREKTDTGGALVIDADGRITRRGAEIAPEELAEALAAEAVSAAPSADAPGAAEPLRVVADRALPARRLNEVLAAARAAGLGPVALVARRAPEDGAASVDPAPADAGPLAAEDVTP